MKINHEEISKTSYNKAAEEYDNSRVGGITQEFKDFLLEIMDVERGCKVLDVACGTGTFLKLLHDKYDIDGYGVDLAENMIKKAKKKNKDFHFTIGSALHLDMFEDFSMDIVTVCAAYHHFPDTDLFMREAYRVLKPGGQIYIAETRLPLPIRLFFNAVLKFYSKDGDVKIYTPQEICETFKRNRFINEKSEAKGIVQVCCAVKPLE